MSYAFSLLLFFQLLKVEGKRSSDVVNGETETQWISFPKAPCLWTSELDSSLVSLPKALLMFPTALFHKKKTHEAELNRWYIPIKPWTLANYSGMHDLWYLLWEEFVFNSNELWGQSHVHLCWLKDHINNFYSWHQPLTWVSSRSYWVTQVKEAEYLSVLV